MADVTYENALKAMRKAHDAGDMASAKRMAKLAASLKPAEQSDARPTAADMLGQSAENSMPTTARTALNNGVAPPEGDSAGSFFKILGAAGAGVARGAADLADLPGAIVNAAGGLAVSGMEKMGLPPQVAGAARQSLQQTPFGTGSTAREGAAEVTGGASEYRVDTTAGRIAGRAGEFLPGAILGGGNPLTYALAPAVGGEVAAQAAEGTTVPEGVPVIGGADGPTVARAAAEIASPFGVAAANSTARKVVTPNPTSAERTAAAKRLEADGIQTTAGQKVGNRNLRYREDAANRTADIAQNQGEQFTAAALKRVGSTASRATPDVIQEIDGRLGSTFDELARRNRVRPDARMAQEADDVVKNYAEMSNASTTIPAISNTAAKIAEAVASGVPISGKQYQEWRATLGRTMFGADSNAAREAAGAMREVLDNAMERSLIAAGRTGDLKRYREVRSQYRDFLAIDRAVSASGESAAVGLISPAQLANAIKAQGKRAFTRGERDLGQLARDGVAVMTPLPNSGTQNRIAANTINAMSGGGTAGVAGGLGYALTKDPQIAAATAAAGAMAPAAFNAFLATAPGQKYLANQLLGLGEGVLNRNALGALASQAIPR